MILYDPLLISKIGATEIEMLSLKWKYSLTECNRVNLAISIQSAAEVLNGISSDKHPIG